LSVTGNWDQRRISRRKFLITSGMGAAALATGGLWLPRDALAQTASTDPTSPFQFGVASGDPFPDSVVLWTRLAKPNTNPLGDLQNGDTYKGQGNLKVGLKIGKMIVNSDGSFTHEQPVTLESTAEERFAHSVHHVATGLASGQRYWYQFTYEGKDSPIGYTKTAPASDSSVSSMKFAFASCQHWENGLYPAYADIAKQDLDLVIHLGDYIYEGAPSSGNVVRKHSAVADPSWGCNTLADYRNRHGQYKTDKNLQEVHRKHPWVVVWDDHEVENDYVGTNSWYRQSDFAKRRAAAYQAYYEHMPLRPSTVILDTQGNVTNIDLYRQITYGDLAQFCMLDTRQYRSYWACPDQGGLIEATCKERTQDPIIRKNKPYRRHTMLGGKVMGSYTEPTPWLKDEQEIWLKGKLTSSGSLWNVLAQQVIMFKYDHHDWTGNYYSESWDSYSATRDRILKHIVEKGVRNPVVLSGDMHSSWAANLESNFDDSLNSDVIGTEFTGTSISSGLGSGWDTTYKNALPYNKHVKYYDGRVGGYLLCTMDKYNWKTEYRLAQSLTNDQSPLSTIATWYVQAGTAGLQNVPKAGAA
jgi:alkaline phosphatase D